MSAVALGGPDYQRGLTRRPDSEIRLLDEMERDAD
jgi:hypothetical protein